MIKIWVNSLDDFKTWELVETDDNYPLFDLLDDQLQNRDLNALGKRVLKTNIENVSLSLDNDQKPPYVYNLSKQISGIPNFNDCQNHEQKNNENVFSSRIEFEDVKPIIIIHRVAGKKVSKKGRKNYSIQLSWIVIGHPTNFDFELDPQSYLTFQSGKFSILKEVINFL
ncbi:hypothetical protein F8M41_013692 [Gigaspora margarita]|uniref:Uncharacterized protein n=1 Tax=Gigaspora margarita TaxID=4874 RepID=A0A8H3WZF0_GIGMA|nr:hypothetical protein F8M41_013692 [Gigaspora margarita]